MLERGFRPWWCSHWVNYINFSDHGLSHTERPIDKLCQEEDTNDSDVLPRANYSDEIIDNGSSHTENPDSNQIKHLTCSR